MDENALTDWRFLPGDGRLLKREISMGFAPVVGHVTSYRGLVPECGVAGGVAGVAWTSDRVRGVSCRATFPLNIRG